VYKSSPTVGEHTFAAELVRQKDHVGASGRRLRATKVEETAANNKLRAD
jgi:hypothetical protein